MNKSIGITEDGKEVELLSGFGCLYESSKNLKSIQIHDGVLITIIVNNNISEFKIPEGLRILWCHGNNIKELELTENIYEIDSDIIDIHGNHTGKILKCGYERISIKRNNRW